MIDQSINLCNYAGFLQKLPPPPPPSIQSFIMIGRKFTFFLLSFYSCDYWSRAGLIGLHIIKILLQLHRSLLVYTLSTSRVSYQASSRCLALLLCVWWAPYLNQRDFSHFFDLSAASLYLACCFHTYIESIIITHILSQLSS